MPVQFDFVWLTCDFPVYLASLPCLVLFCPALSSLKTIIWVYVLVWVFLFLPRVCTVTYTKTYSFLDIFSFRKYEFKVQNKAEDAYKTSIHSDRKCKFSLLILENNLSFCNRKLSDLLSTSCISFTKLNCLWRNRLTFKISRVLCSQPRF